LPSAPFQVDQDHLDDRLERLEDPDPVVGLRSISGTLRRLRSAWSSASEATFGRSRLLYWITRGACRVVPLLRRFIRRFSIDSSFESTRVSCESAQKTTPSTTAQDEPAAGVVEDLAGERVQVEAGLEAADLAQRKGEEVEKEGPLRLGGEEIIFPRDSGFIRCR